MQVPPILKLAQRARVAYAGRRVLGLAVLLSRAHGGFLLLKGRAPCCETTAFDRREKQQAADGRWQADGKAHTAARRRGKLRRLCVFIGVGREERTLARPHFATG